MILESINPNSKHIYVVRLDREEEFKIGRGKDLDIRVSDISVSWLHAIIKKVDNDLILYDEGSKFGTLIC